MIHRFIVTAAFALISVPALAAGNGGKAMRFDIAGLKLGMALEQALPVMERFCGKPAVPSLTSKPHPLTGKRVPESARCTDSTGQTLEVGTGLKMPMDAAQSSVVLHVELNGPGTEDYREQLKAAAVKKYGAPDINLTKTRTGGMATDEHMWCEYTTNKQYGAFCDPTVAMLRRKGSELSLTYMEGGRAEYEAVKAIEDARKKGPSPRI